MNKPNAPKYLLEVDSAGRTSLWDYSESRLENWGSTHFVLVPVVFKDGSVGLLPERQLVAIQNVLDYQLDEEERHFEENAEDSASDEDENHIVHDLRALKFDGFKPLPSPIGDIAKSN